MTLIERLQALVSRLSFGYSERRTVDDAIEAVAERDKLHADIETLRLDLDGLKLIEGERTRLAIKCDALTGEVAEIVKVKEYFRTQLERAESTIALLQTERDEMRDLRDQARRHEGEWAPRLVEVCKQRDAHASALASCHGEISILKMQRDDLAAQVEHYRGETREAKFQISKEVERVDYLVKQRGELCKARDDNASALASAHKELAAAKAERDAIHIRAARALAEVDAAIAKDIKDAESTLARDGFEVRESGIVSHEPAYRPAPPSPLNLVERVLRLEREVLFVRQRPAPGRWPPRR